MPKKLQVVILIFFAVSVLAIIVPLVINAAGTGALYFSDPLTIEGDLNIVGSLAKASGTFVIDHPLDPKNKLLYHSFVESPDVKNIYDGVARLNWNGEAKVKLPKYFEALGKNYRYLATPIGKPAPDLHITQEVDGNVFRIGGGRPFMKVSWQITSIRKDPFILANPIVPEVEKGPDALVEKGEYLYSDIYDESR